MDYANEFVNIKGFACFYYLGGVKNFRIGVIPKRLEVNRLVQWKIAFDIGYFSNVVWRVYRRTIENYAQFVSVHIPHPIGRLAPASCAGGIVPSMAQPGWVGNMRRSLERRNRAAPWG